VVGCQKGQLDVENGWLDVKKAGWVSKKVG